MPNTVESEGANGSARTDQEAPSRAPGREDERERSFLSPLTSDALRVRRASSAELQLPWTCPVTHSREKFYTVCSDYALLNRARPVITSEDAPPTNPDTGVSLVKTNTATPSQCHSGGISVSLDGNCDMEVVSSSNKPVLAWEIDTSDFDVVLTRKTKTSMSLSKMITDIYILLTRSFQTFKISSNYLIQGTLDLVVFMI